MRQLAGLCAGMHLRERCAPLGLAAAPALHSPSCAAHAHGRWAQAARRHLHTAAPRRRRARAAASAAVTGPTGPAPDATASAGNQLTLELQADGLMPLHSEARRQLQQGTPGSPFIPPKALPGMHAAGHACRLSMDTQVRGRSTCVRWQEPYGIQAHHMHPALAIAACCRHAWQATRHYGPVP